MAWNSELSHSYRNRQPDSRLSRDPEGSVPGLNISQIMSTTTVLLKLWTAARYWSTIWVALMRSRWTGTSRKWLVYGLDNRKMEWQVNLKRVLQSANQSLFLLSFMTVHYGWQSIYLRAPLAIRLSKVTRSPLTIHLSMGSLLPTIHLRAPLHHPFI